MTELQKYLDYLQMLRKPYQKLCRLRFLQPDGSTAFMLDNRVKAKGAGTFIADGRINHNWQNGRRTSATVTLDNVDGDYDYNFNSVWFGKEIAMDEGLILSDGETEFYIQQGVFLIENPVENVDPEKRTVTYNLVDKTAALDGTLGGNLDGTYQVLAGTNIFSPIAQLLAEDKGNGYPVDRVAPVFTEYYISKTQKLPDGTVVSMADAPYTLTIDGTDGTIWSVASGLAAMVNGWIGYDETGALRIDPSQDDILDSEKPVEWEFSMDEAELLGMAYTVKNSEVYNDYIVIGEAIITGAQPGGRAQILDPRSPVDINAIGRKTVRVSQVGFFTNTQCEDYAVWQVKRSAILQRAVEISCSQILHIRGNDIVSIVRTDKEGNPTERHLIQGFSRPLASAGAMTISAVSVNDFPIATIIRRGVINVIPSPIGSLTYTGSLQTPSWENLSLVELTPSGNLSGTNAGNYVATFTPKAGYVWWDDTSEAKTNTWSIGKQPVTPPSQAVPLTYNGSTQSVTITGYDSSRMTLSGATSGKNAGTYQATVSLLDTTNYMWSNGTTTPITITWTIGKKAINPPTLTGSYTYTGSAQTVTYSGFDSNTMTKSGTQTATNAGSYTAKVGLADTANYMWNDQTTTDKSYGWSIAKKKLTPPTLTGTYTYTGSAQTVTYTGFDSNTMTKGGTQSATNAGSYTATVSLSNSSNYIWSDNTSAAKSYPWSIAKRKLTPPTLTGTYTYTGSAQTVTYSGFNSGTMTKGGTQTATNAGSYTATISITDTANNVWTDNTSAAKSYPWSIAKANQAVPTLSASSATIGDVNSTGFSVTRSGTGAITATSGNTNIATTSVSGTNVSVFAAATQIGTTTITITVAGDNNYNAYTGTAAKFTVTVTATDTYSIKFSAPSGTVSLQPSNLTKNWDGKLYWSNGSSAWAEWSGTTAISANPLYVRGTSNTKITGDASTNNKKWVLSGSQISCSGKIEALLDWQQVKSGTFTTIGTAAFACLFYECWALVSAPSFSALRVSRQSCKYMFYDCRNLVTPPSTLPATTLDYECYANMFDGCTHMTSAPTLPATTLADNCYAYMFYGNWALTQAPNLPATTLAAYCYYHMFQNCTTFITAPTLRATTAPAGCYAYMFYACTGLVNASPIAATTIQTGCFRSMYDGCTKLTSLPVLKAQKIETDCYSYMFWGCTNIKLSTTKTGAYQNSYRLPPSGTATVGGGAATEMFTNTGGTFTGTPSFNTTYYTSNTLV